MRNPVYEQALDKQGLRWVYQEVSLDDISGDRSLRNQARLETPRRSPATSWRG